MVSLRLFFNSLGCAGRRVTNHKHLTILAKHSLLQAAWDVCNVDVFLTELPGPDQPEVRTWRGKPHVVIGDFPFCDTICGAELTGNDQYMYWEGASANELPLITLPHWVHRITVRMLTDNG